MFSYSTHYHTSKFFSSLIFIYQQLLIHIKEYLKKESVRKTTYNLWWEIERMKNKKLFRTWLGREYGSSVSLSFIYPLEFSSSFGTFFLVTSPSMIIACKRNALVPSCLRSHSSAWERAVLGGVKLKLIRYWGQH